MKQIIKALAFPLAALALLVAINFSLPISSPTLLEEEKQPLVFSTYSSPKQSLTIAVIDTGVNPLVGPEALKFVKKDAQGDAMGYNVVSGVGMNDDIGHGSLVLKLMADYFDFYKISQVKFLPIKYIEERDYERGVHYLFRGIKLAVDQNVDIINISSAGLGFSHAEYDELKRAEEKGILVVVAAGNEGEDAKATYPCAYGLKNIICVGALENKSGRKLATSNFGDSVNLYANGELNTIVNRHRVKSQGTSFAAPRITAAAAIYWLFHPHDSAEEVKFYLQSSTIKKEKLDVFSWKKFTRLP